LLTAILSPLHAKKTRKKTLGCLGQLLVLSGGRAQGRFAARALRSRYGSGAKGKKLNYIVEL
jgi:hypothetical protein